MILKFIGRAEADRLFYQSSLFDREVAAHCKPMPFYNGLIGVVIRRLIRFKRSDEVIKTAIKHYPFEEEYEPNINKSMITILTLCLSDARIELAEFIYKFKKVVNYELIQHNSKYFIPIELSYLHHKSILENIKVLEFLRKKKLLSNYGYWGKVDDSNQYILYYILAKKDDKLAEWATDKMRDNTTLGFGFGILFDLDEVIFISKYLKLFDQRNINIMESALKFAVRYNKTNVIKWFILNKQKYSKQVERPE